MKCSRKNLHHLLVCLLVCSGLVAALLQISNKAGADTKMRLMKLNIFVRDQYGQIVRELSHTDFEIYDDDEKQQIAFYAREQPVRLVMLFDVSASMSATLPALREEAAKFVDSLSYTDQIRIVSFDNQFHQHTEWVGKSVARDVIMKLETSGTSTWMSSPQPIPQPRIPRAPVPSQRRPVPIRDQNTNLYEALTKAFLIEGDTETLLIFSDGADSLTKDEAKQRTIKEAQMVLPKAQETMKQIYSFCLRNIPLPDAPTISILGRGSGARAQCKLLSEIAQTTGGRMFEIESPSDAAIALRKTFEELRSIHHLAYTPRHNFKPGYHPLRVVVKRPDMTVRARAGYLITK